MPLHFSFYMTVNCVALTVLQDGELVNSKLVFIRTTTKDYVDAY